MARPPPGLEEEGRPITLYRADFEILRRGQGENYRGSPLVDQFRLDQFLEMLQRDVGELQTQTAVQGQLVQLSDMGESEWALSLTVPISDALGTFLLGSFKGLL